MSDSTPTMDVQAVAAKHRAMWASGDYPKLATELVAPLGPVLVAGHWHRTGRSSARRGGGHRKRGDSRRGGRSQRRRQRPVPGAVGERPGGRPPSAASTSNGARPTPTNCRSGTTNSMW